MIMLRPNLRITFRNFIKMSGYLEVAQSWIMGGVLLGCLCLTSCSEVKKTLGLDRDPPDEFSVVPRAEISLPPEYNLMPPQPGAPTPGDTMGSMDRRPQEVAAHVKAQKTLFGAHPKSLKKPPNKLSQGEENFLKAMEAEIQPLQLPGEGVGNIRETLDSETGLTTAADKSWVKKVLFWQKPDTLKDAIDPVVEHQAFYGVNPDGTTPTPGTLSTEA